MSDRNEEIAALEALMDSEDDRGGPTNDDIRRLDELRADRNEDIRDAATSLADSLLNAFVEQVAPGLTCSEANAVMGLYEALGRSKDADAILMSHETGDNEPSDEHYVGVKGAKS